MSNIKNARRWLALMVATALLLLLAGAAAISLAPHGVAAAPAAQEGPAPRTVTLYGPTAVTTGTFYTAAPLSANGIDNARTTNYKQADVFAFVDANTSGTVTVTVQASPDETNWVNVTEMQHGVITGTLVNAAYTYRVVLAGASASGLIRAPLPGEYLRVQVVAVGAVTPTVKVTYR